MTAALHAALHSLLGCAWGRDISTADDSEQCSKRAVQIVVLHDTPTGETTEVRLCADHLATTERNTDPHDDGGEP